MDAALTAAQATTQATARRLARELLAPTRAPSTPTRRSRPSTCGRWPGPGSSA
ncbi:MAG: hypothetical protein R3F60_26430 [bacterium]